MLVLVGSNLVETMPPAARHLDRLRERGGKVVVIDPRRTPTADRADLAPPAGAGHRPRARAGGAAPARRRRRGRHVVPRRARPPAGRTCATRSPPGGPSASSGSPGSTRTRCGRWRRCWRAPRVMVLTARGAEQHSTGSDTVLAWINVALALGMVGRRGCGLRLPDGPGQRPGRARARAEGRPAARLPPHRRPRRPRARRRRVGRRPRRAARPRAVGVRAPRRARHARRAVRTAGPRLQHRRQRAATRPT